jgi:hypothetical protein
MSQSFYLARACHTPLIGNLNWQAADACNVEYGVRIEYAAIMASQS